MDGRSSLAALPASAAGMSASAPIPAPPAPSWLTSTFSWSHILDAGTLRCKALLEIWWFSESWQPQIRGFAESWCVCAVHCSCGLVHFTC